MTSATMPSSYAIHRASAMTLIVGLIVSLMIHLGIGLGASGYFASAWRSGDAIGDPIVLDPDLAQTAPPPEELALGMEDASRASIHWLGVVEDPVEGVAPIAEVEQAQFTEQLGNAPVTTASVPAQDPVVAVDPVPAIEPVEKLIEEIEPDPTAEPDQGAPPESVSEQIELEPAQIEEAPVVIAPQPEPVEEPSQADEREPEARPEPNPEEAIGPSLVSVDPNEQEEESKEPEPTQEVAEPIEQPLEQPLEEEQPPVEAQRPTVPSPSPSAAGRDGIVSDRESTASILKRAIKVDAKTLNKPIVGKGLEILTIEPKFPASVRFTQLPKNPVLLIRFDASGRVTKVRFLRDGRHVFDTGATVVDEPLLSAVYKWRAKGKEIDGLEAGNPDSTLEISMRILFHKERSKKP